MTAPHQSGPARPDAAAGRGPGAEAAVDTDDSDLLAALLDGMDAALCAFDAGGTVTHWNREAERILGWTAAEAVGREGLAGWAVRAADAGEVTARLSAAMTAQGRQVHEFPLLTKGGGRVLVRTQLSAVPGAGGRAAGVYCAFSEVHTQIDLERSIALSEALFGDASWGVVLVDADLRPALANAHAARALRTGRTALLGRPLGELLEHGVEEVEGALQHVLAAGAPPAPTDLWVTLRDQGGAPPERRCWRSGFLRLASPLAEEPVPLGVAWLFMDVTAARLVEQESARLRFRGSQLHRAGRAVAECEDPVEAASLFLDFALAGFADHALVDLLSEPGPAPEPPLRLVRAVATPTGTPGPSPTTAPGGLPVPYPEGHPAPQAIERCGSVRAASDCTENWAASRKWPEGTVHALSTPLRSRGRTLGAVTFLRGPSRRPFDRGDAAYAEDVSTRVAAALDLAGAVAKSSPSGA
ncbi:PAS domain-containing protein [Streptomyces sp. HU2014]|uniref:Diguanylate cyclase n=1 Tax=Streptomyces albireticuli TaxID=1940 RepID=A0A1Z2L2B7_9ACTN|nr:MULTISPECIES: PAS domain-containing protein [Streptomyces]ARZ68418.1 diguanylate cyclase [Streptomyces albireticuli]UQI48367.1 PAS domain-containing protein [Streptomyces sp. HU2014]